MKYKLYIFCVAALQVVAGCDSQTKHADRSKNDVELSAENTVKPMIFDESIITDTLYKSSENVVYDLLSFGATKDEYDKYLPNTFNDIGDYDYVFTPEFHVDYGLYKLDIRTVSKSANYIDSDLSLKLENLYDVIKAKYGEPTRLYGDLNFFNFKPGYIQWKYGWDIHSKRIKIGIAENNTGSTYYSVMWIYKDDIMNIINEDIKHKSQKGKTNDSNKF